MSRRRWLQSAALLALGLLILYGLARSVHPAEVGAAIHRASLGWVLAGMLSSVGFILIRSWRWQLILTASTPTARLADATAITAVGFAVNSVSPFKLGELLRIAAIAQRAHLGVGEAGATVVLERVLDVLSLLVLALVATVLSGGGASSASVWSGLVFLSILSSVVAAAAYVMVTHPDGSLRLVGRLSRPLPSRLRQPALDLASSVLRGFSLLRSSRRFALTGLISLAVWIVPIFGLLAYFRSVSMALTPTTLFLAMTLFVITQAVSITPASVGTYEGLFVLVLSAFAAGSATMLTAVAVISHIGGVAVMLATGAVGALWLRMSRRYLPVGLERPAVGQDRT